MKGSQLRRLTFAFWSTEPGIVAIKNRKIDGEQELLGGYG